MIKITDIEAELNNQTFKKDVRFHNIPIKTVQEFADYFETEINVGELTGRQWIEVRQGDVSVEISSPPIK